MTRSKRIILACIVSLVLLIVFNVIYQKYINNNMVEAYISVVDITKGEQIGTHNVKKVKLSLESDMTEMQKNASNIDVQNFYINCNIGVGQIILKSMILDETVYLEKREDMEYIAIPIDNATDAMAYQIKRGDIVDIYYSGKSKLVDSVVKSMKVTKVYSTDSSEAMVSCRIFEKINIVGVYNDTANSLNSTQSTYTQVIVQVSREVALCIANLKLQGTFTMAYIK